MRVVLTGVVEEENGNDYILQQEEFEKINPQK